jgi:hypothetical protein
MLPNNPIQLQEFVNNKDQPKTAVQAPNILENEFSISHSSEVTHMNIICAQQDAESNRQGTRG